MQPARVTDALLVLRAMKIEGIRIRVRVRVRVRIRVRIRVRVRFRVRVRVKERMWNCNKRMYWHQG
jgi:hypothetical protein